MRFRPCIDIHNGKVRQIVGGSLKDAGDTAVTNFSSEKGADYYAAKYRTDGLAGGHVILLNSVDSPYYGEDRRQAMRALRAYPGGLQIGGGITDGNAAEYLDAGASHVIVTSFVFYEGGIHTDRLIRLCKEVGKKHLVLDLSCRKVEDAYYIACNRWQTLTNIRVDETLLNELAEYCDEFLVHGVDAEGKSAGIESGLVKILAGWKNLPITYAGGIGSLSDIQYFREVSGGSLDYTIGSALDLFGGDIPYDTVKFL